MCEVFIVSEIFEASTGPQPKIYIIYKMSSENSLRYYSNASYLGSGGAEVTGALRTTLPLGPPMENKFQGPDKDAHQCFIFTMVKENFEF